MDPNLIALLHNNEVPTVHQAQEIGCLLDSLRPEVSRLEDAILKLSTVVSHLKFTKRRREKFLTDLQGVLSPIRRIPAEILAEIFLHCRNNSSCAATYALTDTREAPLLLGHVCSRWRMVSYGTPRLWDIVGLPTTSVLETPTEAYIRTLLQRSRTLPLQISVFIPSPEYAPYAHLYRSRRALYILWDFHDRMQNITLDLPAGVTELDTLPRRQSLSILTSADITMTGWDIDSSVTRFLDLFEDAPLLRSLKLEADEPSPSDISTCKFPWVQLTSMYIDVPINALTARDILAQCTHLVTCRFRNVEPAEDDELVRPITLPFLQTLELILGTGYHEGDIHEGPSVSFIRTFTLPRLNALKLELYDWRPHVLRDLHSRSRFTLEHLCLFGLRFQPDELASFLHLLPALNSLSLEFSNYIGTDLFRLFVYDAGSESPFTLKSLTKLELHELADDLDGDLVADMAESLWRHVGDLNAPFPAIQLVKVHLDGRRFPSAVEERLATVCPPSFLIDVVDRSY
ncbi:hypothetical protein B0H11DRAFT_753727 [Mycena galericulata]|nr:hypothetical protein B0H11DRAFT_753727 [Mycena galericulata]